MMFTSSNDLEDSIYSVDHCSFPSPLNYLEFDGAILQYWNNISHDQPSFGTNNEPISAIVVEQEKGEIIGYNLSSSKKKTRVLKRAPFKSDRHSKIPTANGLRDRRMRLSVDVARQFFKLQDMLSYDKPSKTVKWLLLQAKPAIQELDKGKQSPCSGSEGELVESGIDHDVDVGKAKNSKKKSKKKRSFDQFRPAAKQLRKEARERARERTLKKKQGLVDFGGYLSPYKPCSSDVVCEIEHQIQDEITQDWSSLMSLSFHQEDDSCKLNPISESQHLIHPDLGELWFY